MSRIQSSWLQWLPRQLPVILALLGIGWCFRYVIARQTPVGGVEGQVYLTDTHKPLGGVKITLVAVPANDNASNADGDDSSDDGSGDASDNSADPPPVRHVVSDASGRFVLHNVPTGKYEVSASTHAHHVVDSAVYVNEGQTTPLSLGMQRSLPAFQVIVHQRVYGTQEKAHLSISGYVDIDQPAHQDRCSLRLYHARLSRLLRDADAAQAINQIGGDFDVPPSLPDALLHPSGAPRPERLLAKEVRIHGEDKEGFFYQNLDFGKLDTGLYLIDLAHGKNTGCAWLLVTDTALIVKRAGPQLVAFAVDMHTGQPIVNSAIRSYRAGKLIAQGATDERGLAELAVPNPSEDNNDASTMTIAIRGRDEAVVQRDGASREENANFAVHAYTDRTIYRPGQRIFFKGIARRVVPLPTESGLRAIDAAASEPTLRYAVPAGLPVEVELLDPKGDSLLRRTYTLNSYGSFNGMVDLLDEAVTGVYTLKMHLADDEFTHDIVVASYRKPEFAVTITPDKKRYARGEEVTISIQGQYYFGAPVAGAKVEYSVYSSPDWAAEYPDDYGYDEEEDRPVFTHYRGDSYFGGSVADGKARLDTDGKAVIHFRASPSGASDDEPQDMVYTCHATVTAEADREVEQDGEAHVVAGNFRLTVEPDGYVAAPGQPMNVIVQARDYDGQPVPNQIVSFETSYESWSDDQYHLKRLSLQSVTTGADGRCILTVTPPREGNLVLTARAADSEHHAIRGRASLWVAGDAGGDLDTTYNDLSLLTDKRRYQPGDTARVLVNAARLGETVLLTVEGDRVYRSQTLVISHHSTVVRVPLPAQYGPDVFLAACYVRDKHFAQSSIPLRVTLPASELKISVQADRETAEEEKGRKGEGEEKQGTGKREEGTVDPNSDTRHPIPYTLYKPGDRITYHVLTTDTQGRPVPCEFSLGVVDEAIYALQEDDPNALRDAFYPRRSNSVETIYSFAAEYLGDADKAEPQIVARKKFPDTAFWQPDLHTDSEGRADVSFILPDNLTTWRATVMAHTPDTRLGRAVDKVMVTKPFLVRIETPRTLTQRDHSQIVAIVHNDTGQPQSANVRLRTDLLTVSGPALQTQTIASGSTGTFAWPVSADLFGKADVKVTAWTAPSGGSQYTDGMEITLPIRPHGREDVTTFAGELTSANPESEVLRLDPNAVPGTSRVTIRITPSIASALTGGLDYLTGFPYGCVEQTMSRLLPDLLVQRALHQRGAGEVANAQQLPRMVRDGLLRLYRFQHDSGAWGWWQHDSDDAWMTAYVLYGLSVAQAEGYPVNAGAFAKARKAAAAMTQRTPRGNVPFLMYALALSGDTDAARKARAVLNLPVYLPRMQPDALAYVVLTDRILGDDPMPARAALDGKAIMEDQMVHWTSQSEFDYDGRSATALALRAILATDPQDPRIEQILRWLMLKRTGEYWEDTKDTACVLAAFCDYLSRQPGYSGGGSVQVQLNGRAVGSYALTESNLQEKELALRLPSSSLRPGKNDVLLTRVGGTSPIFYTVQLRQTIATEDVPALTTTGLVVKREYLRVTNNEGHGGVWRLDAQPTHNLLNMSDHIRVRLTIKAPRDLDYVLIEDPFPAGCEVNERGDPEDITDWSYWWSSVDVRDDKIAFFARTLTKGEHVVEYNLRAQTPGSYHTMPTLVQAMYAPEMRAESEEARIEIK